jgi:hypothetical protein
VPCEAPVSPRDGLHGLGDTRARGGGADDLAYWRATIPGKVEAAAEALTGPMTLEGQRVQLLNAPGNEVGSGIATWGRATADRAEAFGWNFEWDGKSSKHIPFDWSGP